MKVPRWIAQDGGFTALLIVLTCGILLGAFLSLAVFQQVADMDSHMTYLRLETQRTGQAVYRMCNPKLTEAHPDP